ncbi:MAG: serine hydrolase [Algoriphagus sp.]|uniref:serine hydrolase domain-containing protein n=1 Tax=Algoriphagus sp. TaxID=1872435 RepID=UPI00261B5633|nr:serine hydrolase domain-containing protein [Algoriphagus sp.]MDG1278320.1 serine hydrolase [Algoriphagus sp.]
MVPKIKILGLFGWVFLFFSCAEAQKPQNQNLYFPPNGSVAWESIPVTELGWDAVKLAELLTWLPTQDTRAFIILKDGKIVVEEYWGENLTGLGKMNQDSFWYWASAGKTLTAALVGIAEEQKLLKISDRTQEYLGEGWTAMSNIQEQEIKIIHHLTMTTGLDDQNVDLDNTNPESLTYLAEPGQRWSYHNAPYTLLEKVVENASGKSYQTYFEEQIGKRIGMSGFWQKSGFNNVFFSNARSFARFGLLLQAKGNWNGDKIWSSNYFDALSESSTDINRAYGYLTWLNGKSSYMLPQSQTVFPGMLIPQGPADMYQAMGKNGQFLMVVPSQGLVIVRMGGSGDNALVPFLLIRDIWERLSPVIGN